jgi:putative transposase
LGCPNGCDFCCTSHFFKKRHIKLLPKGRDIYDVVERYLIRDPNMVFTIIDEDFLLDKKRAMQFRDCVLAGGKPVSAFVFSSVKALSQYAVQEILEMGIDGIWIGYEGTRSGYSKQSGRLVHELIGELREHGITVLTSMIVGFDYQTPEVISQELDGLTALRPELAQFLIYRPPPGTPFYDRVMSQGLMRSEYVEDVDKRWHDGCGFKSIVKHPTMSPSEIEGMQRWCFAQDFQRVGRRHEPKAHDGTIVTSQPNEIWGTDMTTTVTTREGKAAVFVAVDHFNAECVGIHASKSQTRFEALEPLRQGVREYFGAFAEKVAEGLIVRHDHGSQYMADDFQDELIFLGMTASPSFVREPQGNGCAERFIRTLKENLLWVRTFETVEQLRQAVLKFKKDYNEKWMIQRLGHQTPAQARRNACSPPKKVA